MKLYRFIKTNFCTKPLRNPIFSNICETDIQYFRSFLSDSSIITNKDELTPFNHDWMKKYFGNSKLVLKPKCTEDVSKIVKHCYERKLGITPQSGNTGLVGGSVPVHDEIIVSMALMNKIYKFDPNSSVLSCEAGCILESLNIYLKEFGYEVPLDLGAKGSCMIGGNLSTNAGGKYLIKYGSIKSAVVGLEVVTGTGEILNLQSELRKDNTGYDLKQIFLGAEGTLGIITKINLVMQKLDTNRQLLFLRVKSFADVLKVLKTSKIVLGKNLAAIEFIDYSSFTVAIEKLRLNNPFEKTEETNYYVIVEIASNSSIDQLIENMYEELTKNDLFIECLLSDSLTSFNAFWKIREGCPIGMMEVNPNLKYDMSIDPILMEETVIKIRNFLKNEAFVASYGHIGDGNLHINVAVPKDKLEEVKERLESWIFKYIHENKGSISAEHGIGLHKTKFLEMIKTPLALRYFRGIKEIFDPHYIMNPYKIVNPLEN